MKQELFSLQNNPPVILRVGVIGCGDRGNGIIEVMKELPEFSVNAICDVLDFRIEDCKKILPQQANTAVYKDYRRLLDDKNIDAVVIATPLNMHYQIAAAALDAGKHVYLEKTMTY